MTDHLLLHRRAAAVNADIAAQRKALLEVRWPDSERASASFSDQIFGDDESNINQVAEHPYVEKHIAAFLPSRRNTFFVSSKFARYSETDQSLTQTHQDADLERYAIAGTEDEWNTALQGSSGRSNKLLSVKRKAGSKDKHAWESKDKKDKKASNEPSSDKKKNKDKKHKKSSAHKRLKGT